MAAREIVAREQFETMTIITLAFADSTEEDVMNQKVSIINAAYASDEISRARMVEAISRASVLKMK